MPKSVENAIMDSFELVKDNYAKFLLIYLVMAAVSAVILLIFVVIVLLGLGGSITLRSVAPLVGTVLIGIIILFLTSPVWTGIYYSMVLQELGSRRVSIFDAVGAAKKTYAGLLLTLFLQTVVYLVVYAIIFSPLVRPVLALINGSGGASGAGLSALAGPILKLLLIGVLVFVGFLVATFILMPLLYEAVPLVMLENLGGLDAIKRSVDIGRKNFWKLVWLITVFWFAVGIVYFAEWIVAAIFGVLGHAVGVIASVALSLLVAAFVVAWSYALQIVFYKEFISNKKS